MSMLRCVHVCHHATSVLPLPHLTAVLPQGLSFLEPMLLCLSLCSAALAPALWGLDSSLAATPS